MEVFVIKYIYYKCRYDNNTDDVTEMFYEEVKFKTRLTELQDDWDAEDIKVYSGFIPRITL